MKQILLVLLCHAALVFLTAAENLLPLPTGKAVLISDAPTGSVQKAKPTMTGDVIRCLNKELIILPQKGAFYISANGETLLTYYNSYTVIDAKTGKRDWTFPNDGRFYDNTKQKIRREQNRYTYDAYMKYGSLNWHQYHMEIELMPDGLIRIHTEAFPSPDESIVKVHVVNNFMRAEKGMIQGKKFTVNDTSRILDPARKEVFSSDRRTRSFLGIFYHGDPAREIRLTADRSSGFSALTARVVNNSLMLMLSGQKKTWFLDLRKGVLSESSKEFRGGVDFRRLEGMEMPEQTGKNLFFNPSFEQGLKGYFVRHQGYCVDPLKWETDFYAVDRKTVLFGKRSLRMFAHHNPSARRDYRELLYPPNLGTMPVVLEKGRYTVSFFLRGESDSLYLKAWCPGFRYSSSWLPITGSAKISVPATREWKRHSFTFELKNPDLFTMQMNAAGEKGTGFLWIDGLQLEKGGSPTAFESKIAEGELLTSDPENLVEAGKKIHAKLRITTKPEGKGNVRIRVRNFYGETVFDQTFPFAADASGEAWLDLPFDNGKIGTGLFILRKDYRLDNGEKTFEHDRFAVVRSLSGRHRWKEIFGNIYAHEPQRSDHIRRLQRYIRIGIHNAYHVYENRGERVHYERFGFDPPGLMAVRFQENIRRNNRTETVSAGWGIPAPSAGPENRIPSLRSNLSLPGVKALIRDHKTEKVSPDDAYFARFREAVKIRTLANMHIRKWEFENELFAAFGVSWWSARQDPDEAAALYAKYLKAYYEGVKEANPKAIVMQDAPYNMSDSGIEETRRLLEACTALGFRFDAIAHHIYRYSPEEPDLDAHLERMKAILRKNGYPENTPFHFGEGMHWGPYEIPAWGLKCSKWAHTPTTWPANMALSYDMGQTERKSAAWRARAWLVALKNAPRILQMNSGNTNNFELDVMQTPRASQLVSNTLGNLLGDAVFQKDIRFAPFIRTFVFTDSEERPVAAVWCHKQEVDEGKEDAPVAEADFGDSLECIVDLMNQERAFSRGHLKFPVTGAPLFLRGRRGTLTQMVSALSSAKVRSGTGIAPVQLSGNPETPDRLRIEFRNFLSAPFHGTLEGKKVSVPPNGISDLALPLPGILAKEKETAVPLPLILKSEEGGEFPFDLSFRALLAGKVADDVTLKTIRWTALPSVPLTNRVRNPGEGFRAAYRIAWNAKGIFLSIEVKDRKFSHYEFAITGNRWDNDCVQIYFDTRANARSGQSRGYDQDDYDYAIYPDRTGSSSIVYRSRSADRQLTLGVDAPPDNTVANEIPSEFHRTGDGYCYRVFFPEQFLRPAVLAKGHAVGVGICVNDANDDSVTSWLKRRCGSLSNATLPGSDCFNKPHLYPVVLLWE